MRTITTCGKYLASGGADDRICIYDMVQRKEHVMLTHHNSTVNCLQFTPGCTHLISSSTDGSLYITRVGNWVIEKLWEKSHKNGHVIALAVHPTGKLLLTLGSDCSLQTWNLIKGRKAFVVNLNSKSTDAKSLSFIKWCTDGEKFLLGGGNNVEIWNINIGGILKKFNYKSKVTCATWFDEKLIVIGHEDGKLRIVNFETEDTYEFNAFNNRVKCLEITKGYLITASSSGLVKIWSINTNSIDEDTLNEICSTSTGCRITCVCVVDGIKVKKEEKIEETETPEEIVKQINTKGRIIIEEDNDDELMRRKKRKNKKRQNNEENKSEVKKQKLEEPHQEENKKNKVSFDELGMSDVSVSKKMKKHKQKNVKFEQNIKVQFENNKNKKQRKMKEINESASAEDKPEEIVGETKKNKQKKRNNQNEETSDNATVFSRKQKGIKEKSKSLNKKNKKEHSFTEWSVEST